MSVRAVSPYPVGVPSVVGGPVLAASDPVPVSSAAAAPWYVRATLPAVALASSLGMAACSSLQPSPTSTQVHLVEHVEANDAPTDSWFMEDIPQLQQAKQAGANRLSVDLSIHRTHQSAEGPKWSGWDLAQGACFAAVEAGCVVGLVMSARNMKSADPWVRNLGRAMTPLCAVAAVAVPMVAAQSTSLSHAYHSAVGERWSGYRTYRVQADGAHVTSKAVGDSLEPQRITEFSGMHLAQPSPVKLLEFNGHGLAYQEMGGMPYRDFQSIVRDSTQAGREPADILMLQTCYGGNLEALLPLQPYARFALVSEDTHGMNASDTLLADTLRHGSTADARRLGVAMVHSADRLSELPDAPLHTLALIDMTKLPALGQATDQLGAALNQEIDDGHQTDLHDVLHRTARFQHAPSLGDERSFAANLLQHYSSGPASHYVHAPQVRQTAHNVLSALDQAVVATHLDGNHAGMGGVSVQLPTASMKVRAPWSPQDAYRESGAPDSWRRWVFAMSERY